MSYYQHHHTLRLAEAFTRGGCRQKKVGTEDMRQTGLGLMGGGKIGNRIIKKEGPLPEPTQKVEAKRWPKLSRPLKMFEPRADVLSIKSSPLLACKGGKPAHVGCIR